MNDENISEANIKSLIQIAVQKHQSGELDAAESLYKQILQIQPKDEQEKEYRPIIIGNLGNIFERQGKLDAAVEHYQQTLRLKPDYAEAYYNLGNVFQRQGKLDAAVESYQQALKIKPEIAQVHSNLGNVLQRQGKLKAAVESYQQALKIKPDYAQPHYNLGDIFLKQGKLGAAVESYQQALKIKPDYGIAHHQLGNAFHMQGELEAAAESYRQAINFLPDSIVTDTYFNLGNIYSDQGKLKEVIETYEQALKINPDYSPAKFGILINQLPIIYSSVAEINIQRNKYKQYLDELAKSYQTANSQQLKQAVQSVGALQPFFLAYQGLNDRDLQQTFGEMLVQIMSSNYPQLSKDIPLPDLQPNEKIRIGFVSRFFYGHSNWKIPIKGWVENLDRSEFEFFAYHTYFNRDQNTAKAAKEFDKFTQGTRPLEEWCKLIQEDKLHVLIFPEFGMDPTTLQLGCLRLAPVQITSWGHPNTSGLPTIDYYLSSDLMEPENAQEHYTEKLVRLPNLSINYTPLAIEAKAISKKDIGITDNEIMLWCCQSLFKYLPNHDDVFPRIAKELTNSKFVFIQHKSEYVTEVFRQRLRDAFEEFGLNYQNHCIFLPGMDIRTFTGTAAIADVFLDSIGWSGCNSTLEAIAHNIPVVTIPGELMRGRHSMAILKMMGIEETIASSKEEYVEIAIRLGRDAQYRQHISQLVAENKHKLYNDLKPVRALEEFLFEVVGKPKISTPDNIGDRLRLAIQEHRANRLEAAEQAYQEVLAIEPKHPEALYGLGMVTQQRGELQQGEEFLSSAVQEQPNSVKIWFALGNLYQIQQKLSAAEEAYKKAVALRSDAAAIYNNLGFTLEQQGKWKEAINSYQKALEIQPNCIEADANLGNVLHAQSQLSPDKLTYYAKLNYQLGLNRKKAGDLQNAEAYLKKALELKPDYKEVGKCLEEIYQSQSN